MNTILKTDFSDARVLPTDDPQWDKLVLPAGAIPIMYEAGTREDRSASIIDNVLSNELEFLVRNATVPGDRDGHYKGRVQLNCALPDVEFVNLRTRLLLDVEAYSTYPKNNSWFTIAELWAGAASSRNPFRISLNLAKGSGVGMPIFFSISGSQHNRYGRWVTVWSRANRVDRPQFGEWFDLELSCRMGSFQTGNVRLVVGGRNFFNIMNWTYSCISLNTVPFTMIQPCKLYTSGAVIDHMRKAGQPVRILWNSLEILA